MRGLHFFVKVICQELGLLMNQEWRDAFYDCAYAGLFAFFLAFFVTFCVWLLNQSA